MKISISLGGSLLTRDQSPENFQKYTEVLKFLHGKGHQVIVVCGGGKAAREWIEFSKKLGADSYTQDRLGIHATHLNALFLIAALGSKAHHHIHRRGGEVKRNFGNKILVGGGHLPNSSTDYRAVLFAEAVNADLVINATDYGGVFDKDPSKYSDAQQYNEMTYLELIELIENRFTQSPGNYGLFDLKAVKRLEKNKIPLIIIDGTDPHEIIRAVEGGHKGTEVRD
jgi:uridylate kinase